MHPTSGSEATGPDLAAPRARLAPTRAPVVGR